MIFLLFEHPIYLPSLAKFFKPSCQSRCTVYAAALASKAKSPNMPGIPGSFHQGNHRNGLFKSWNTLHGFSVRFLNLTCRPEPGLDQPTPHYCWLISGMGRNVARCLQFVCHEKPAGEVKKAMRWHGRLSHQEYGRLLSAALTLFGSHKVSEADFWQTLTQQKLKQAFREKAKFCHPDLNGDMGPATVKVAQERFIVVKDSYEVLKRFLATDLFRSLDG
jgi:hypothetical protein